MQAAAHSILAFDDFELDADRLELRRGGRLVKADHVVLRLLARLVRTPGQLVTKDELVEDVWDGRAVADTAITVSMARLRKALGDRRGEHELVVTVHGRGYRFVRPVITRSAAPVTAAVQHTGLDEPPFVGRERVLARMRAALDEARMGRGRLLVLMGEPGIGKTRAVEAFERELAGSDVRVLWGYCREAGDTPPLWPWLRLRREVAAGGAGDGAEASAGTAVSADLRALLREVGGSIPPPAGREGYDGIEALWLLGPARHSVFDAVLNTFKRASEHHALVLVLDDVHRADSATLELLRYALDELAHTKLLVLATLRHSRGQPAPRPDTQLPHSLGHRNCERITLERLSSQDVASYVGAVIDDPDGRFSRAVFDKCEGNPFFMTELARELQEADHPDPSALAVPAAALALIRQRVEKLTPETRDVLSAAAVIGRSFELPLLQAATEREPTALMASLDEAIAAEVVIAAPDSVTAFAFGHELLRAVSYEALRPRERRQWHLRVARALEQRASMGDVAPPSELAYHFHAALPDSDPRKTVQYCRAAAVASGAVFANVDVVRYMKQALEALDLLEKPSVRLRMVLLNGICIYGRSFAPHDAAAAMRELLSLAREHGDGVMLMRAAVMLNPRPGITHQPGTHAALSAAEQLLVDQPALRSIALSCLAAAPPTCFDRTRAEAVLEEAAQLARAATFPNTTQALLRSQLYLRGGPAHEQEAEQTHAALTQLAQQHPRMMPVLPADLALWRAIWSLQRGDDAGLRASLERCASRCRELGPGEILWHAERYAALRLINRGSWPEGWSALTALHRHAEQRGFPDTAVYCAFDRAVLFSEPHDSAPLDEGLRSTLEIDGSEPPSIWSLKVRALSAVGLPEDARAALRVVSPDRLALLPCDSQYLGTLGHLARAALALQDRDYIAALYPLLEPYPRYYSAHASFLCEGAVPQLLGMLAFALGRRDQALAQLEAGLRMNEDAGIATRSAETRYELARVLLDGGSPADIARAVELAREAETGAARYGMHRLARAAAALLRTGVG